MCDGVFGSEAQTDVATIPIVELVLSSFNGTILVYGQSSSGKTNIMTGDHNNPAIPPLAIQNIRYSIENTPDCIYLVRAF